MGREYRIGEVAARTGVTIRTLRHYDRIGLLGPTGHSDGGHRRYVEGDLLRLQQALTLRYLGFRPRQVGETLDRPDFVLLASLDARRTVPRERIVTLERIEADLAEMVGSHRATGEWAWEHVLAAAASARSGLHERETRMETLYTPEQLARFEEVERRVVPAERAAIEAAWPPLIAEVRTHLGLDPDSREARDLAARWDDLLARTMAPYERFEDLTVAIGENIERGAFAGRPDAPDPATLAFIVRVHAARGGDSGLASP